VLPLPTGLGAGAPARQVHSVRAKRPSCIAADGLPGVPWGNAGLTADGKRTCQGFSLRWSRAARTGRRTNSAVLRALRLGRD